MLTINKIPVPDLRPDGAMTPYHDDIAKGLVDLVASSGGDELPLETRNAIVARLVLWSYDEKPHPFPSWKMAVRAANNDVTQPGGLGKAREAVAKERDETKFNMAMGSSNWANCGKTADNILYALRESVPDLAATQKTTKPVIHAAGSGAALATMLRELPPAGTVLLFDCSLPQVHTFLIEVHPNGARYLCQGYQGAYYANWWTGKDSKGLILGAEMVPAEDLKRLAVACDDFGRGMIISSARYLSMIDVLGQALDASKQDATVALEAATKMASARGADEDIEYRADVLEYKQAWGAFAKRWLELPFCPVAAEVTTVASRGGRPTVEVTRYAIPDLSHATGTSITVPFVPDTIST